MFNGFSPRTIDFMWQLRRRADSPQPSGEELYAPDLIARIANGFLSLMPLYDYLITLDSDPTPRK